MNILKKSTAATILVGPVSGADITSCAIGDFNITINGSTSALADPTSVTHSHNGYYLLSLTTTDLDTAGRLSISCNKTGYSMPLVNYSVLLPAVYNAFIVYDIGVAGGFLAYGSGTGQINPASGNVTLTQTFPTHFESLSIDASGRVDIGSILGTTSDAPPGYVGISSLSILV